MAGKKQKPYEYHRALKRQSPEIQAMIRTGEKADEKAAAKRKKKKEELSLLRRTKRRLRKVFKGY